MVVKDCGFKQICSKIIDDYKKIFISNIYMDNNDIIENKSIISLSISHDKETDIVEYIVTKPLLSNKKIQTELERFVYMTNIVKIYKRIYLYKENNSDIKTIYPDFEKCFINKSIMQLMDERILWVSCDIDYVDGTNKILDIPIKGVTSGFILKNKNDNNDGYKLSTKNYFTAIKIFKDEYDTEKTKTNIDIEKVDEVEYIDTKLKISDFEILNYDRLKTLRITYEDFTILYMYESKLGYEKAVEVAYVENGYLTMKDVPIELLEYMEWVQDIVAIAHDHNIDTYNIVDAQNINKESIDEIEKSMNDFIFRGIKE